MKLFLSVPGPANDRRLREVAERMWTDFANTIQNPLGNPDVVYDTAPYAPTGVAWSRPLYGRRMGGGLGDRAVIIPSIGLLTEAPTVEQRLTLLHECLHMAFAFGEHRSRWQRLEEQGRERELARLDIEDRDSQRAAHMEQQDVAAFNLLRIPDEIVAEQRLKRDYPDWFSQRAEYYVQMRRDRAAEIAAGRADILWPFSVFYELLRISLFIPLLDTTPELRQELERLEAQTAASLRACTNEELADFLMDLKPRLLDVSHDGPLDNAEVEYDRLFERVIAT